MLFYKTEIIPNFLFRGISTRVLSSVWAFFILVIVSYYKAQLCASLTVESTELAFKDLEELVTKADKLGIRYGAVENEAIHTFFIVLIITKVLFCMS